MDIKNSTQSDITAIAGVTDNIKPLAKSRGVIIKKYIRVAAMICKILGSFSPFSLCLVSGFNLPISSCWKNRRVVAVIDIDTTEAMIDIVCVGAETGTISYTKKFAD